MKLMTKKMESLFNKYPLYSQDGKGMEATVVACYYNVLGAGHWFITEGTKQENGDWMMFGYCHINCWQWGYVLLSELESIGTIARDTTIMGDVKVKDLMRNYR